MTMNMRKATRLTEYDYSSDGAYFITICTKDRRMLFWKNNVIGQMKRQVSKLIGEGIWQKSFYDHIIRNRHDYDAVWKYIDKPQ